MGLLQKLLRPVVWVLFVALWSTPYTGSASVEEANALLKWKETLQGASTSVLTTWILDPKNGSGSSASSPCNWFGVSCNAEGSVTQLNLMNSSVNGTLETFPCSSFANLAYVDLRMNELSGPIPSQISSLPLVYLNLSTNEFSGNIPPEIGLLAKLETLHLQQNHLSGSIPREIGQLKSLSELALYTNHLSGPIPSSLGNLSNLVSLYLYDNQLSGSIPEEMGNLSNLELVYMDSNSLTGPIASTLGNLERLTVLHLFNNTLSGSIPNTIGNLKALVSLSLHTNNLSGSIPQTLGDLTSLTHLHLYMNQLSGSIPNEVGNLKFLVDLKLSDNQLSGSIPASFGNLSKLTHLFLRVNNLSGAIPKEFRNLKNLVVLEMEGNQFSGDLPDICQGTAISSSPAQGIRIIISPYGLLTTESASAGTVAVTAPSIAAMSQGNHPGAFISFLSSSPPTSADDISLKDEVDQHLLPPMDQVAQLVGSAMKLAFEYMLEPQSAISAIHEPSIQGDTDSKATSGRVLPHRNGRATPSRILQGIVELDILAEQNRRFQVFS
ncbi:hypothetical protein RHSIM_Rhsim07G0202200 [Rhododendron simsii]|uniref:non-specific serine/threonine protein kinase n=1 Tax=Rhododendron simsii TaxID=118357 RepID=A0A834GM88_RHOSS|nr:hypothetical protein RHSIM_Rhsim07G0202200 [Rhododendron simsii]